MTPDNPRGLAVAWRNRIGPDRWLYSERDPRQVHDNGKQVDALVLATDYTTLLNERAELLARCEGMEAASWSRRYAYIAGYKQGAQDHASSPIDAATLFDSAVSSAEHDGFTNGDPITPAELK
jgi:hypothetical protein